MRTWLKGHLRVPRPREFAKARGFSDAALRYWAGRLERRPALPNAQLAETPMRVASLARVVRPGELPPPLTAGAEVLVHVGKAAIAVRPGFDPGLLRDVLRVLTEA